MRLRIALVAAVMAGGALVVSTARAADGATLPAERSKVPARSTIAGWAPGPLGVPTGGGSNGTTVPTNLSKVPALYTMPVSGVAKNGKRFTGTYGIQRFVARNGHAYASGTVKGTLKGRHVTRYGVLMLASLAGATGAQTSQAACPILHLVIAPI